MLVLALLAGTSTPGIQQPNPKLSVHEALQVQQNIQKTITPQPQPTWEQRIAPMVAADEQQKAADALAAQQTAEQAALEAAQRAQPVAAPSEVQASQPSGMPAVMLRIRACESGNNYTAQNPSSTASGAYQFLDSTWAGFGGYARAMYAPASVQDQYALQEYNADGTSPWAASESCWG